MKGIILFTVTCCMIFLACNNPDLALDQPESLSLNKEYATKSAGRLSDSMVNKICQHDYWHFAKDMPNEFYFSYGFTHATFRFWFSDTLVLGIKPYWYDRLHGVTMTDQETRYLIHPIVMSSYSELEFPLPGCDNEYGKNWEVRIYTTDCFNDHTTILRDGPCKHYLSCHIHYTFPGDNPEYSHPEKMVFQEVKEN